MRIKSDVDSFETFFDRQERLEGWDQNRLANAKVMIAGAGALGNETLKNLALLGVSKFLICDFDTIETSNLSRTVLFSRNDLGLKKVDVAAERIAELILDKDPSIEKFDGDIVWELGIGRIADCDIVLGCLDNVEARKHLGITCNHLGIPYIDSGISNLSGHVSVYPESATACYSCNMSKAQELAISRRYSCDDVKRKAAEESKVPTVQVASALISAIQCQEAIKLLMDQGENHSFKISYDGANHIFDKFDLLSSEICSSINHYRLEYSAAPIMSSMTLTEALTVLKERFGDEVKIDLSGDRYFLKRARCRGCTEWVSVLKPNFAVTEEDLFCGPEKTCKGNEKYALISSNEPTQKENIWVFDSSLDDISHLTLEQLGIPKGHIITVLLSDQEYVVRIDKS